ncbi:hypothetical protein BSKO_13092 [Bryopsis sp. KO-2023]|nr:hypothetical protein BSKO_13092 [Bryopsis sp. KO-2023]
MNDIDALEIDSDEEPRERKRKKTAEGFTVPVSLALGASPTVGQSVAASRALPPFDKSNADGNANRNRGSDGDVIASLFGGEGAFRNNSEVDPITALFQRAKQGQPERKRPEAAAAAGTSAPPTRPTSQKMSDSRDGMRSDRPQEKCHAFSAGYDIPGPAGRLQRALARDAPFSMGGNRVAKKPRSNQEGFDISFLSNAWTAGSQAIGQEQLTPNFGHVSIKKALSQTSHEKIKQMLVFVADVRPNGEQSAFARVKDPTGSMGAILHQTTLAAHPNISSGAVLVLKEVTVFSPSPDIAYLCIMPGTIKKVLRESSDDPTLTADTLHQRLNSCSSPQAQQNGIHSQFPLHISGSFPSKSRPSPWTNRPVVPIATQTTASSQCTPTTTSSIDDVLNQFRDTPNRSSLQWPGRVGGGGAGGGGGGYISLDLEMGPGDVQERRRRSCKTMPPPPPRSTAQTSDSIASCNNRPSAVPGAAPVKVEEGGGVRGGKESVDHSPENVLDLFEEVRECYGMSTQSPLRPCVQQEMGFSGAYQSKEISLDDAFTQKRTETKANGNQDIRKHFPPKI